MPVAPPSASVGLVGWQAAMLTEGGAHTNEDVAQPPETLLSLICSQRGCLIPHGGDRGDKVLEPPPASSTGKTVTMIL